MSEGKIYTRAYSKSSAGKLVSAKTPKGDPLSDTALLEEFRNHAKIRNQEPTALVSGSDRIVDTLKRAFEKHKDGERSADIWIVFIAEPQTINETATRIHSAKELAEKCQLEEPKRFSHEVLFEWAIPEEYVLHQVSLHTLIERGLQGSWFSQPTTVEVRRYIAEKLQQQSPWEIGVTLGCFARKFGARSPLNWISHQLFFDCVWMEEVDNEVLSLNYANGHIEINDSQQYSYDLEDGIDTSLHEWWLSDVDIFLSYQEFEELRDVTEDSIVWDQIDFFETWHHVHCNGIFNELSVREQLAYDEEKNKLWAKIEKQRADIETEAVRIGL
ncbi:hypothetical protein HYALB_00002336 [Hymenoscyphus albidus]|uniref:DUF7587 domain-containing protein n=1 Tax=Hymenoscyphus albidus TaxID=595503 RepID=A0A9N9M1U7_9HELO|nr:hypothetical protein HYALB_00002336 [Hymenoscyphus albidus]